MTTGVLIVHTSVAHEKNTRANATSWIIILDRSNIIATLTTENV